MRPADRNVRGGQPEDTGLDESGRLDETGSPGVPAPADPPMVEVVHDDGPLAEPAAKGGPLEEPAAGGTSPGEPAPGADPPLEADPLVHEEVLVVEPVDEEAGSVDSGVGAGQQPHGRQDGSGDRERFVARWQEIQAGFVDEPRRAVQDADALVADLMDRLAQLLASEREQLESHWGTGVDVSTEDLRQGLRRYRSLFERLLAAELPAEAPR